MKIVEWLVKMDKWWWCAGWVGDFGELRNLNGWPGRKGCGGVRLGLYVQIFWLKE